MTTRKILAEFGAIALIGGLAACSAAGGGLAASAPASSAPAVRRRDDQPPPGPAATHPNTEIILSRPEENDRKTIISRYSLKALLDKLETL